MSDKEEQMSQSQLDDLVLENDAGARNPSSKIASAILIGGALLWSLFQLSLETEIRYMLNFSDNHIRSVHLAFAIF